MGLGTKLAIGAVGAAVAIGADSGLANIVYDAIDKLVDPYWAENIAVVGGTATAVGAAGSAMYQGARDVLKRFTDGSSKLPHCAAALGISMLAYLTADTELAYELYDAVMLSSFNVSAVDKAFETLACVGMIGSGLGTIYHGVKDCVNGIGRRFSKPTDGQ